MPNDLLIALMGVGFTVIVIAFGAVAALLWCVAVGVRDELKSAPPSQARRALEPKP